MSTPVDSASPGILDVIKRLSGNTEKLELALEQALQALRKRGFQLSTDLSGMTRTLQQDIAVVQKTANGMTAKQQQMQELIRILALINTSLNIEQVLQDVIDTVIALTGAERAYLLLSHEDSQELTIRAARNWDQETLAQDDVVFSRSVVNAAIAQKAPILTTNAQSDERFQGMQSVFNHSLRSIVCIPLIQRERIIGVLYADNRIGQGVFAQDSIPLLQAFAFQAAIAIENARTFSQVKADLDQAQREVQILRIQIDQQKMQEQLGEITESEYFQNLQARVVALRARGGRRPDAKS
jgi:GAF domain-containing protein